MHRKPKIPRYKDWLIKIALLLGTLCICYLLGEVIVYLKFRKQIVIFPRFVSGTSYGEYRIRHNIPNIKYRHKSYDGSWEFRINSQGFRSGEEFTYQKPAETYRILILGDSFSMGYEVNQEECYSEILGQYLRSRGRSVQVINASVSGFSNAEELIFFQEEGIKYSPDVVILGFFENDIKDNVRTGLYTLEDGQLRINQKTYLPAVSIRDTLNSFFLYRWLSMHSYLHNYLNNVLTVEVKKRLAKKNIKKVGETTTEVKKSPNQSNYSEELTCAIVKKIHSIAQSEDIFFILLDIPNADLQSSSPFKNGPSCCDYYLDAAVILKGYKNAGELYRPHAHRHWAPLSHRVVGEKLGEVIESRLR